MPYLTPTKTAGFITRCFSIPVYLIPYVNGLLYEGARAIAWKEWGDSTPQECAEAILEAIFTMRTMPVGAIQATVGPLPPGCLWCDGMMYSKEAYPRLYAQIDPSFLTGENFYVPDLNGRFVLGGAGVGATGGEENHTLTVEEIPSHAHSSYAFLETGLAGELPDTSVGWQYPQDTGATGGGQPHNNMPPYLTARYYIVAE